MKTTKYNATMGTQAVQALHTDGSYAFWGNAEYTTKDGWVGIRQPGGRMDEWPIDRVVVDPT